MRSKTALANRRRSLAFRQSVKDVVQLISPAKPVRGILSHSPLIAIALPNAVRKRNAPEPRYSPQLPTRRRLFATKTSTKLPAFLKNFMKRSVSDCDSTDWHLVRLSLLLHYKILCIEQGKKNCNGDCVQGRSLCTVHHQCLGTKLETKRELGPKKRKWTKA